MRHGSLGISALALLMSMPALAQDASDPSPDDSTADVETQFGEIIVTATRRPETIEEVPVAISNFGADQLDAAGVTDVRKLTSLSPSFNFTSSVSESYGATIRIRGVGTSGSNPGLESAVGVYIDGVYRNRAGLAVNDVPGIERVELLRGPQGTLFGKNTTAGVVNVITSRPSFDTEVAGSLQIGNYDLRQGQLSVSGPVVQDLLAARLDVFGQQRDGLLRDTNGREYYSRDRYQLRGQLLLTPTPDIDVRLIADYTKRDEGPGNAIPYRVADPNAAAVRVLTALGAAPRVSFDAADSGRIVSQSPGDFFDRGTDWGLSGEVNWDLGAVQVTSITAFRKFSARRSYDVEGSLLDLLRDPLDGEDFRTFTQELRLNGEIGALNWMIGGFYANEQVVSYDSYVFGTDLERYLSQLVGGISFTPFTGQPAGQSFRANAQASLDRHQQDSKSFSVFTHNSYEVVPGLKLTAGLRYTTEKKSISSILRSDNPACAGAVALYGELLTGVPAGLRGLLCVPNFDTRLDGDYSDSRRESEWSGTGSIAYEVSPTLHAYASYSRGYKAGGYNLDRAGLAFPNPRGSDLRFSPEFADAYEIGFKGVFANRTFRPSLTLFQTKFSDYQYTYNLLLPSGVPQRVTTNLPELVTRGVELETSWNATPDLSFSANATYQDSAFGKSGFPTGLTQLQGTQAPNAPRWLATGSVGYAPQLGETGLKLGIYLDGRWQSRANVSSSGAVTPQYFQDAYAMIDARIGIAEINDRWGIDLFARNLFDETVWTQLVPATLQSGAIYGYISEPRLWGLRGSFRF